MYQQSNYGYHRNWPILSIQFCKITGCYHTQYGQFVLPALYELLIATYTWSGAFLVVSSIALQCLPFGLIIHSARDYYVTGNEDDETVTSSKSDTYSSLMSDVLIWIILGNCLLVALTGDTFMYLTSKRCIHLLYSKSCIRRRSLKQLFSLVVF